jgi:hypothetical protein
LTAAFTCIVVITGCRMIDSCHHDHVRNNYYRHYHWGTQDQSDYRYEKHTNESIVLNENAPSAHTVGSHSSWEEWYWAVNMMPRPTTRRHTHNQLSSQQFSNLPIATMIPVMAFTNMSVVALSGTNRSIERKWPMCI